MDLYFGFLIFVLGSRSCGLAQSSTQLILFRVLQGIGGAMIMANGRALVTVNSPASERGKALGFTSMAFHVGYITGPTLGGFIIDAVGWRWVFFLTVPDRSGLRLFRLENSQRTRRQRSDLSKWTLPAPPICC